MSNYMRRLIEVQERLRVYMGSELEIARINPPGVVKIYILGQEGELQMWALPLLEQLKELGLSADIPSLDSLQQQCSSALFDPSSPDNEARAAQWRAVVNESRKSAETQSKGMRRRTQVIGFMGIGVVLCVFLLGIPGVRSLIGCAIAQWMGRPGCTGPTGETSEDWGRDAIAAGAIASTRLTSNDSHQTIRMQS